MNADWRSSLAKLNTIRPPASANTKTIHKSFRSRSRIRPFPQDAETGYALGTPPASRIAMRLVLVQHDSLDARADDALAPISRKDEPERLDRGKNSRRVATSRSRTTCHGETLFDEFIVDKWLRHLFAIAAELRLHDLERGPGIVVDDLPRLERSVPHLGADRHMRRAEIRAKERQCGRDRPIFREVRRCRKRKAVAQLLSARSARRG